MNEMDTGNAGAASGARAAALNWKLAFEEALAGVSGRFVRVFDLDDAISDSLADVGKLSGADRVYLFQFRT